MCQRVVNRINTTVVSFLVTDFMALADGVVTRNTEFTLKRSDEGARKSSMTKALQYSLNVEARDPATSVEKTIGRTPVLFADLIDSQGRGLGFFFRVDERHAVAQVFKAVKLR